MKYLSVYWTVGCILCGLAMADMARECPTAMEGTPVDAAAMVAIWPAFVIADISMRRSGSKFPLPSVCKGKVQQ